MEDGLLVSHHLSISNCQGVVATLQVKILKCQFDYLDTRWNITTVTISECVWHKVQGRALIPSVALSYLSITFFKKKKKVWYELSHKN